jgi:hypothetical protein
MATETETYIEYVVVDSGWGPLASRYNTLAIARLERDRLRREFPESRYSIAKRTVTVTPWKPVAR